MHVSAVPGCIHAPAGGAAEQVAMLKAGTYLFSRLDMGVQAVEDVTLEMMAVWPLWETGSAELRAAALPAAAGEAAQRSADGEGRRRRWETRRRHLHVPQGVGASSNPVQPCGASVAFELPDGTPGTFHSVPVSSPGRSGSAGGHQVALTQVRAKMGYGGSWHFRCPDSLPTSSIGLD